MASSATATAFLVVCIRFFGTMYTYIPEMIYSSEKPRVVCVNISSSCCCIFSCCFANHWKNNEKAYHKAENKLWNRLEKKRIQFWVSSQI